MSQLIQFLSTSNSSCNDIRAVAPVVHQKFKTIAAGSGATYQDLLPLLTSGDCVADGGQVVNTGCNDVKLKLSYLDYQDCDECTVDVAVNTTPPVQSYFADKTGFYLGVEGPKVVQSTVETGLPVYNFNSNTLGSGQTIAWSGVGTFTNATIAASSTYAGLSGSNFLNANAGASEITFTLATGTTANYLGFFWGTMANAACNIKFYKNNVLVATVPITDVTGFGLASGYNGNPTNQTGDGMNYKSAYVNIWLDSGTTYDKIVFGGGSLTVENMQVGMVPYLFGPITTDIEVIVPKNSAFPLPPGLVTQIQVQTVDSSGAAFANAVDQSVSYYSAYTPPCTGCVTMP
jgi:hypothetical protein